MRNLLLLAGVTAIAAFLSGCAVIGRYTEPTASGNRVTVGLISFDAVSDGYPMIPLYSSFESK